MQGGMVAIVQITPTVEVLLVLVLLLLLLLLLQTSNNGMQGGDIGPPSRRWLKILPSCFPLTKCMQLCMLTIFSGWYIVRHISYLFNYTLLFLLLFKDLFDIFSKMYTVMQVHNFYRVTYGQKNFINHRVFKIFLIFFHYEVSN